MSTEPTPDNPRQPSFWAWFGLVAVLALSFIWWARHQTTIVSAPTAPAGSKKFSLRKLRGQGPVRSSSKLNLDPEHNVYPDEPPPTEVYQDLLKGFVTEVEQMKTQVGETNFNQVIEITKRRKEWQERETRFLEIARGWEKMDDDTRAQNLPEVAETLNWGVAAIRDAIQETKLTR